MTPSRRRHPHKALNARAVAAHSANGKAQRIADGGGLYLLIAPGGSKSWVLRTLVHGRRCDIGLGSTALVTLAEARDEAHRLRKVARSGGDPMAERRERRREVPTFRTAATQAHASLSRTFRNLKHSVQWLSSLTDVFAAFGSKRVNAVSSADVLTVLSQTWTVRPETSRRVLQRVRAVFDWSKAQGFVSGDNPTVGLTKVLPKNKGTRNHHAALPYPQVPAFVSALRADGRTGEPVKLAFEFTILCAGRTSETLLATWSEVDFQTETWTIPAARMKAGVEHRVPLAARSVEILKSAQELSNGGPYVFPSQRPSKPLSSMCFLMTLRRMKLQGVTPHGFRSSFRDWAEEQANFPKAVTEAALAHVVRDKTEAAYLRTDLFDRRRQLMNQWATFATAAPNARRA